MEETLQQFLNDKSAYYKKRKKSRNFVYIMFGVAAGLMLLGFILLIAIALITEDSSNNFGLIVFLIGFFTPTIYTVPLAIRGANTIEDEEPKYESYYLLHEDGRITAETEETDSGSMWFFRLIVFICALILAPVI